MKKAITILLSAIVLLFAACSPDSPEPATDNADLVVNGSQITEVISDDFPASAESLISLTGLEEGALYGIVPYSSGSRSLEESRATENPALTRTDGGTYLHSSDGNPLAFTGIEVGISDSGSVRFIRYKSTEGGDMTIDSANDTPLYYTKDGYPVFEEYYLVNLDNIKGLDKSRVSFMTHIWGSDSFSGSAWAGMIDENTLRATNKGLVDLSGKTYVSIFNQFVKHSGSRKFTAVLTSPEMITKDEDFTLQSPAVYEVAKSENELVLEIDLNGYEFTDLPITYSTLNGKYAYGDKAGNRKAYCFPISYNSSEDKLVIYVGDVDENFIFSWQLNEEEDLDQTFTARLRDITSAEKELINYVEVKDKGESKEIEVKPENYFTPIIYTGDTTAMDIYFTSSDADDQLLMAFSHLDSFGFENLSLKNGELLSSRARHMSEIILDSGTITNRNGNSSLVKLYFSKDSDFSFVEQPSYSQEIDGSALEYKLTNAYTVTGNAWEELKLTGLQEGNIYGIHIERSENLSTRPSGWRSLRCKIR